MTERDNTPRHIWDTLRRLLRCNKQQLAARLGVSRHTLARWEDATEAGEPPGTHAEAAARELLIATLRAANGADAYASPRERAGH